MRKPLLTDEHHARMQENFRNRHLNGHDPQPVVKLFTPDAQMTWLLTEQDPDEPDLLFGLADLGMGFPELGYVSLSELQTLRGNLNLPVERDLHFSPHGTLSQYAEDAHQKGSIDSTTRFAA